MILTNKSNVPHVIRILTLLALPLAFFSIGSAATLQGRVTEVVDGGTIVVVSVHQPIRVRLIAAAAPDKNQSYASVARQHLSDLILDKFVRVRFSALADGYLVGQVLLDERDISAQMIRDGVAWYDKSDASNITEPERQLYEASMEAARSERRGLWQDETPVSPWDFRKAQTAPASAVSLPRQPSRVRSGGSAGLSSEDLMGGMIGPGSRAGKPDIKRISPDGSAGHWLKYQSADHHFSILAPSDAVEITYPILDGQGKLMDLRYVIGTSNRTLYFVMWTKGPNGNSTDASTSAEAASALVAGINHSLERANFALTITPGRNLKLQDYSGRQYSLSGGPATGLVRVLSKQIGSEREVFVLCVVNGPEAQASGEEFLNSLKIGQ